MECFDVIGVGFGPSNLSVAIALDEIKGAKNAPLNLKFYESKQHFSWHPNMMMPGTKMQVSFLKDLATLRNPSSEYTFLNYLKTNNRLEHFANLRDFFPSRHEYNDYFRWAAQAFCHAVEYNTRVNAVSPVVNSDGSVSMLKVSTHCQATGADKTVLAKNVILGMGGKPRVPNGIELRNKNFSYHACEFLQAIEKYDTSKAYDFVVAGSGQSAAEIYNYLLDHFPNSRVTCAIRGYAFKPSDDSEFVNEIFSSKMVDTFYNIGKENTQRLIDQHKDTNYSVVDPDLIRDIYHKLYQQKVVGNHNNTIANHVELSSLDEQQDCGFATLKNCLDGTTTQHRYDGIFLATGYERSLHHSILKNLEDYIQYDDNRNIAVDRHYRVQTNDAFTPGMYLQGTNEHSHGLSDTLLSMIAVRSDEIAKTITQQTLDLSNKRIG